MMKFKIERSQDRLIVEVSLSISLLGVIAAIASYFGF